MSTSRFPFPRWRPAALLLSLGLLAVGGSGRVAAQDLQELYVKATDLAQQGQYAEAIEVYAAAISNLGDFGWDDYGPVFGGLFYDKGVCHLQLKQYDEAIAAFKACHDDYPPADKIPYGSRKTKSKVVSENMRWELSVFQRGFALQQQGKYEEALAAYQQFVDLKPDPTILKPIHAAYVLRRGKCLLGTGKLQEGETEILRLFKEPQVFNASGQLLFQAMLDLCLGWIDSAAAGGDKAAIAKSFNEFFDAYGGIFSLGAYDKAKLGFVDSLRVIGYRAQQSGLYVMALRVFAMVPSTQDIVDDLTVRSTQTGGSARAAIQQELQNYQAMLEASDPPELETLRLVAASWEGLGNRMAGYVINKRLIDQYPNAKSMPQLIHEAARYAFALGDANAAQYFGETFMARFPTHELRDNVSGFMLQSIFRNRKYDLCLEVAGKVRNNFPAGDPKRELADFIYGACLYYLNRQTEAEPELALHVDSYKESGNRESSRFFQASNKIMLSKFTDAAGMLDSFLRDYPASPFRAQALFDRATCYYMGDDYVSALQRLDEIFSNHSGTNVVGRALILKGDVVRAMARFPEEGKEEKDYWKDAQTAFLEGREAAERLEQADTRATALYKIVDISVELEDWEKATAAYDAFFPTHAGHFYEPQISVFGMPALQAVGRAEEGLAQLEKMIATVAQGQDVELLAKVIGSYQEAALEHRGPEKTLAKYDEMIAAAGASPALQTQLLIHKIMVYGEQRKALAKEDEAGRKVLQGQIDGVFQKLKDYPMASLSDIALRAIGENLETQNPFEAKPFFEELLLRGNPLYAASAEMALGRIEMGPPLNDNAVQRFRRVVTNYTDPKYEAEKLIPEAHVNIGRFAVAKKDWKLGEEFLGIYLDKKTWDAAVKERRAEALHLYGLCLENLGKADEAITVYNSNFATYGAYPEWSAQSVERGFNLGYNRTDYPTPEAKAEGQLKAYKYLRVVLFQWNKLPDGQFAALDRIRLLRDRIEGELGLNADAIRQIEFDLGIDKPAPAR
jgi:tetratricopeptide (TPR) repeat protein